MTWPTQLVGIVNITPDSFSGDGAPDIAAARTRIETQWSAGASVLDLGAESTRPGATPLTAEEEWQRLAPVLNVLPPGDYSLDTRHASTAAHALATRRIAWINDVSGLADPAMAGVLVSYPECRYVLMHALSVPASPLDLLPDNADPVTDVLDWAEAKLARLVSLGVARERVIFDPGVGFGKTPAQSVALMRALPELKRLGVPVMIGHSRKSFLRLVTDRPAEARDLETAVLSARLARLGADYLRVHDVSATRRALAASALLP